jgi:hypothetical protein
MRNRELPPQFRRYNIARIHQFRDREYRVYTKDRGHYRGQYFQPGKEGRGQHREMREPAHDGQRGMREQRPEGRGGEQREMGHER